MKPIVVLIILDGWGLGRPDDSNPIYLAKLQTLPWLEKNFPATSLQASGISVGLPWGETSNSEVGHLTLGAGKVIYQYYPRITLGIRDQSFFANPALKSAFDHARANHAAVNLMGLLSKGNVHASLEHLQALLQMAESEAVPVKLHLFADGKDSPPKTFKEFIRQVPGDKLVSLIGRYYAMDHNKNWRLTEKAYQTLIGQGGEVVQDFKPALENLYDQKLSEEFLPPLRLRPESPLQDNEALIIFNFRADGIRQLAEALLLPDFPHFRTKPLKNFHIVTLTRYAERFTVPVAFPPESVNEPLGKILADHHLSQLRLAETYKYAHVTYFFNGYVEKPFPGEYRVLIPSLNTSRLPEHPELMASAITDRAISAIENHSFDFILINYANGDVIAHTGNLEAGVKAAEIVDQEMGRLLKVSLSVPAILLITSDHGNLEEMRNPWTGSVETQHDPNPVPCYLVGAGLKGRTFLNQTAWREESLGILSDVAPTILRLLDLTPPPEMTGHNLLTKLA